MKLHEEFKLYENMWEDPSEEPKVSKESLDFTTILKANEIAGTP